MERGEGASEAAPVGGRRVAVLDPREDEQPRHLWRAVLSEQRLRHEQVGARGQRGFAKCGEAFGFGLEGVAAWPGVPLGEKRAARGTGGLRLDARGVRGVAAADRARAVNGAGNGFEPLADGVWQHGAQPSATAR